MKIFRKNKPANSNDSARVEITSEAEPSPVSANHCPAAFHVLAKPTGAICNLDCEYCFFLSKDQLYPNSKFKMTDETLENYLTQLIAAHSRVKQVSVAWQGGEPTLMGLNFFKRAVSIVNSQLKPGQTAKHSIQTNATKLDSEWAAFFKENNFLVGVSIDGPEHIHDFYRKTKTGKGSFHQVIKGLNALRQAGVEWNALTTVHAANSGQGREVYAFLRDECGARHIQFIPIVERVEESDQKPILIGSGKKRPLYVQNGDDVTSRSVSAKAYGQFLIDVWEEWIRNDVGSVYVQMFETALENQIKGRSSLCVFAETCGQAVAVEHNGDVYSCDHFVEPDYLLGNLNQTPIDVLVGSEKQVAFGNTKKDSLPEQCLECPVLNMCRGGCPKDRFLESGSIKTLNYLCAGYKRFFLHVQEPIAWIEKALVQNRAPAEIMDAYSEWDKKLSRTVCRCGSGKQTRSCHGRKWNLIKNQT